MQPLFTAIYAFTLLMMTIESSQTLHQVESVNTTQSKDHQPLNPLPVQRLLATPGNVCNLSGTYARVTDISSCSTININALTVTAGVTLDLSAAKQGAVIIFSGTTTFGTTNWEGPLVSIGGTDLTIKGSGILNGQGAWYWKQGAAAIRPVFFRLLGAIDSTVSGFTILNAPYRTISIVSSKHTTINAITIDTRAGNGVAKNTDGFDLNKNDHITITNCKVYNQDDCFAMQSSTNTIFNNNYCGNGHGISIGSIGGEAVDQSTSVVGFTAQGNTIENSDNGLRIKAVAGLKGLVSDVKFIGNKVLNVQNAIAIHSDYSRASGSYSGSPTSLVTITGVTISGLTGKATNLYDIVANPKAVSAWTFSGITVSFSSKGTVSGLPPGISL